MGLTNKRFAVGVLVGLCLAACAAATFPYKYYGLDVANSMLLGPTPADDLALSSCLPSAIDKSPCVGMFSDAFLKLKQDYLDTKNQLISCQHQLMSGGSSFH